MIHQLRNHGVNINENEIAFADVMPESSEELCQECCQQKPEARCNVCLSLLCDTCFDRVHASKTLQSHSKTILRNVNDLVNKDIVAPLSGLKLKSELQSSSLVEDLLRKCEEKQSQVEQSILDTNEIYRAMHTNLEPIRTMRQEIESYINGLQKLLSQTLRTALENLDKIEKSTIGSYKKSERALKHLDEELKKMMRELKNIADSDSQRIQKIIPTLTYLMKEPDSIEVNKKCEIRQSLPFPEDCLQTLKDNWETYDFGTGGEYILVRRLDNVSEMLENQLSEYSLVEVRSDITNERSEILAPASRNKWYGQASNYRSIEVAKSPGNLSKTREKANVFKINPRPTPISVLKNQAFSSKIDNQRKRVPGHLLINNEYDNYDTHITEGPYDNGMHASAPNEAMLSTVDRGIRMDSPLNVYVSHVESPSDFWVQIDPMKLEHLNFALQHEEITVRSVDESDQLDKDTIFLTNNGDQWYRVRVLSVDDSSNVQVLFIDYGYKRSIDRFSLRKIENCDNVQAVDPLAWNCRLFGCYPTGAPNWTEKMIDCFKKTVEKQMMIMLIIGLTKSKFDVDLGNNKYRSLRNHLVSLEGAQYEPANSEVPRNTKPSAMKKFEKGISYKPGDAFCAKVSHVVSPGEFYVQEYFDKVLDKKYKKMNDDLTDYFRNHTNYRECFLRNVIDGLAVVAQYSRDLKWYRAEILRSPKNDARSMVQYVDFGTTEMLSPKQIRAFPEKYSTFIDQPRRALCCALFDVVPARRSWHNAVDSFSSLVREEKFQVQVHGVTQSGLQVSLHKRSYANKENNSTSCINEMLIQEGKANGIGIYEKISSLSKEEEPTDEQVSVALVTSDEDNLSPNEKPELDRNMKHSPSDVNKKERKDSRKLPILILECSDPYSIYVQIEGQRISMADLSSKMTKYYNDTNSGTPLSETVLGQRCAVLIEKDGKWCRAKALSEASDDKIHVFLNDYGRYEDVPLQNIRLLEDEFTKMVDGMTHCYLHDFKNENSWPSELCERLKKLTRCYEHYFMSIMGKTKTMLGITLWAKVMECDGPLDPTRTEWININARLKNGDDEEEISTNVCRLPRESHLSKLRSDSSSKGSDQMVEKWLRDMSEGASKKCPDHSLSSPLGTADEDMDIGDSASAVIDIDDERDQWIPPAPLKAKKFIAIPKYVTDSMEICFQLEKDQKIIEELQAKIKEHYALKNRPPFNDWTLGQICMAVFPLDGCWYRAQIMNIDEDRHELFVEYVDYGNMDWVMMSDVRSDVTMTREPIKCHKLSVLTSYEKVPRDIVLYLQLQIADVKCEIELTRENRESCYRIKSLIYTKHEMGQSQLTSFYEEVDRLMAAKLTPIPVAKENQSNIDTSDDSTKDEDSSISSIQDMSEAPFIRQDQIRLKCFENFIFSSRDQLTDNPTLRVSVLQPPISKDVVVRVTEVFNEHMIAINIISGDSDTNISKMYQEFLELEAEWKKNSIKQPLIKSPCIGRLCCTTFEENVWYRAIVLEKDNCTDMYAVYYLDYGNTEYKVLSNLHQLKPEWYEVPAQAIKCKVNLNCPMTDELVDKMLNSEYRAQIQKISHRKRRSESKQIEYFLQLFDEE